VAFELDAGESNLVREGPYEGLKELARAEMKHSVPEFEKDPMRG